MFWAFTKMYIKIRVTPGAKKEEIAKKSADMFIIRVREPAERNLANQRVKELIAKEFGVPLYKVRIVTGHTSPSKILAVEDPHGPTPLGRTILPKM